MVSLPRSDANLCSSDDSNCMGANTPIPTSSSTPTPNPSSFHSSFSMRNWGGLIIVLVLVFISFTLWFGCRRWPGRPEGCGGRRRAQKDEEVTKCEEGADSGGGDGEEEKHGEQEGQGEARKIREKAPAIVVVAPGDMHTRERPRV